MISHSHLEKPEHTHTQTADIDMVPKLFKYKIQEIFKDLSRTSQYFSRTISVHVKKLVRRLKKLVQTRRYEKRNFGSFYYSFCQISDQAYQ